MAINTPSAPVRAQSRARLGLALFLAALCAASHAACALRTMELPVKIVDHRAIATVVIAGTPVPLMVDTGAFYSTLSPEVAARLKLPLVDAPQRLDVRGVTGHVPMRSTTVRHLRIQDGEIPSIEFLVGGQPLSGAMGLLGRNILSFEDTEYDFAHGVVRFVGRDGDCSGAHLAYWDKDDAASEIRLARTGAEIAPPIEATARIDGQPVQVMLDSGATSVVTLEAARLLGLHWNADEPQGTLRGLGEGDTPYWTSHVDKFEIGDEEIRNTSLRVAKIEDSGVSMLLGIEFFLSHRIYVASTSRRAFFTYNGGKVFGLDPDASTTSSP